MGIVIWIIVGLIAGILAKWILPTRTANGLLSTLILGVLGAFVGGYIGSIFGFGAVGVLNIEGIVTATLGAIILLFAIRLIRK